MKKKILSMALACALVLSASQTAGAADTEITAPDATSKAYESKVEVSADVSTPTIKITLSDTSAKKVGINPYGLKYEAASGKEVTDAIANLEETITNESDVAIAVNVTTKVEVAQNSGAVIATSALKGTETTKSVFSLLQVKAKDSAADALTSAPTYDSKDAGQLVFGSKETTKKAMVTLAAGDTSATYAGYKIWGQVAPTPAQAWTSTDALKYTIVFQFDPVIPKVSSGS
ncbi:MAG: hypothetical protein K2K09_07740 [Lachnospiraceae bacterium]|nr:hypothetical protein [Lachnospiraceae bacterium]